MQALAFWQRETPWGWLDGNDGATTDAPVSRSLAEPRIGLQEGPVRAGKTALEQRQALSLPRFRGDRPRPREAVLEAGGFIGFRR